MVLSNENNTKKKKLSFWFFSDWIKSLRDEFHNFFFFLSYRRREPALIFLRLFQT